MWFDVVLGTVVWFFACVGRLDELQTVRVRALGMVVMVMIHRASSSQRFRGYYELTAVQRNLPQKLIEAEEAVQPRDAEKVAFVSLKFVDTGVAIATRRSLNTQ